MAKILVVDDEPEVCSVFEEFLSGKGYQVLTANSGEEAVAKFRRENPILVLLDISMPGMTGVEVLKKIRQLNEEVGIIMVSALQDEELAKDSLQSGASDYIMKPVDLTYLETCVFTKFATLTW